MTDERRPISFWVSGINLYEVSPSDFDVMTGFITADNPEKKEAIKVREVIDSEPDELKNLAQRLIDKNNENSDLIIQLAEMRALAVKLCETLKFYSNKECYELSYNERHADYDDPEINSDMGNKAQEALEAAKLLVL